MFVAGWNIFASNGNSHHGHGHAHECEHEHDHDHFHEHSGCSDELELASERAAAFLESRALVAGASDAMARLLHAERELRELDGTGERVGEMLDVLESTKEAEVKGIEHADDAVEFESVDILAPVGIDSDNGTENLSPSDEVLVRGLTFRWERGMNIVGAHTLFTQQPVYLTRVATSAYPRPEWVGQIVVVAASCGTVAVQGNPIAGLL